MTPSICIRRFAHWSTLCIASLTLAAIAFSASSASAAEPAKFSLTTFSADITPPLGHSLCGGLVKPAEKITDRLQARGIVLFGSGQPIVLVALDWTELRNDAYDRWRNELAKRAGTDPKRVLLVCLHQHDAPYADLTAQKLLDEQGMKGTIVDPEFHEQAVQAVATALAESLKGPKQPITDIGIGQAKVDRVASNRRVELPDGRHNFGRYSFTRDPAIRAAGEGLIDPWLKTISFWNGDKQLAAINTYATHPMSFYGGGEVSYDFVGMARAMRQADDERVFQIYTSGCSGDITAGKYNEGNLEGRIAVAKRLHAAMVEAAKNTKRTPLEKIDFRSADLKLEYPPEEKMSAESLQATIKDTTKPPVQRIYAALGLSWLKRLAANQPVDVPLVDFGPAQYVILPAETFVGYQLAAQQLRPDSFVMVSGYSECAPGYTPTAEAFAEGFVKEHGYCWVAPSADERIKQALAAVLKPEK